MNVGDADHPHDLTDDQLDALLAAADGELLQHIQAEVDPTATLIAVMTGTAAGAPVPPPRQPERGASKHHDHPAGLIAWRFTARRLARDVDLAHDLASELDRPRDEALDVAVYLYQVLARALDLAHNLDQALDRAHDVSPALFDNLTRAQRGTSYLIDNGVQGHGVVRVVVNDLAQARSRTRDLSSASGEIDASEADLSHLEIDDLDLVAGVVWTAGTVWPPGVRRRVLARSREIRAGVFQVGSGTERASLFMSH